MSAVLLAELKRRRVFRALVASHRLCSPSCRWSSRSCTGSGLPDWTLSFRDHCLGLGFPVVLVLAWIFDVSAAGVERTAPLPTGGGPSWLPSRDQYRRRGAAASAHRRPSAIRARLNGQCLRLESAVRSTRLPTRRRSRRAPDDRKTKTEAMITTRASNRATRARA